MDRLSRCGRGNARSLFGLECAVLDLKLLVDQAVPDDKPVRSCNRHSMRADSITSCFVRRSLAYGLRFADGVCDVVKLHRAASCRTCRSLRERRLRRFALIACNQPRRTGVSGQAQLQASCGFGNRMQQPDSAPAEPTLVRAAFCGPRVNPTGLICELGFLWRNSPMRFSAVVAVISVTFVMSGPVSAQSTSASRSRSKSRLRAEYERKVKQREKERAAEKARLAKGPSKEELRRAGSPITAAKKFLATARTFRSPSQLKNYLPKSRWETHEAQVKRFDPAYARKQLKAIGNRKDSKAELTRRINTHPDKSFVENYRKIGKQVREVTGAHWHPRDKFKAVVTGKVIPDSVRDSFGNKAPTASLIFVLEDGRWKLEEYKFSIAVIRSGGR